MTNFDEAMDNILVQNKLLEEVTNKSMGDSQQDLAVIFIFFKIKYYFYFIKRLIPYSIK